MLTVERYNFCAQKMDEDEWSPATMKTEYIAEEE